MPTSAGVSKAAWDNKTCFHQCLSPWRGSHLVPASPANASKLVSGFPSLTFSAFQSGAFALVFGSSVSVLKIFKTKLSIPWSSILFLDFQSQLFLDAHLSCAKSRSWGAWSGVWVPPFSGQRSILLRFLSMWITTAGVWFYPWWDLVSASPTCLDAVFLPLLWRLCFQVPFQERYPICSCRFVLSFGGGAFRTFLSCHLEPSSLSYLTFLIVNSITFLFYLF